MPTAWLLALWKTLQLSLAPVQAGVLFSAQDYIKLVDYTGRIIRPDKRGAIPAHLPSILQRLNLDGKSWVNNATQFEQMFYRKFSRKRQHLADAG